MITVRRLRIGEAQLFKQMRLASLRESPSAFSSTFESAQLRSPESWSEQVDSTAQGSDRTTFIAFSGDLPIGLAALYKSGGGTGVGELLQVWVAPEHRGQGAAVDLMDAVFQWAAENGFRTVVAAVAKSNVRALQFYRKNGFEPAEKAPLDALDDAIVLMKRVEYAIH